MLCPECGHCSHVPSCPYLARLEWERRAAQAETPADLERIRGLFETRPRVL